MDRAFGQLRKAIRSVEGNENTLIWYCSDNGGLPKVGATGGRGVKGAVYEGGLRVPAVLDWPTRIPEHRSTSFPSNTSDIFPTLLQIVGASPPPGRPLDGLSLVPVIDDLTEERPQAMGFWHFPTKGVRTPSKEWMAELLEAQQRGNMVGDSSRLRLEAGQLVHSYPADSLLGHAAWLDYPWKLHRIEDQQGAVELELYDLSVDSLEQRNVLDKQKDLADMMENQLLDWQKSVVRSMNGEDYP